jgi:oligopeptide transport system substrate-binding protein
VAFIVLLLAACGGPPATPEAPSPVAEQSPTPTDTPVPSSTATTTGSLEMVSPTLKVLNINLGAYHDNLDPQKAAFVNEIAVLQLAYEGLTRFDPNGNVLPAQAERWTVAPDAKTITFTLRADLKRADGTPISARDFEASFKRLVDPRVAGEYNTLLDDVVGAVEARTSDPHAIQADIAKVMNSVGVTATGDLTLIVSLRRAAGFWPAIAATWAGWPADSRAVEKDPQYWWTRPESHNGNGPFTIVQIDYGRRISLAANPNYWGGKPKLDRVDFYYLTDAGAALQAYREGRIDITPLAAQSMITATADATLSPDLLSGPVGWTTFLAYNAKRSPFDEKAVRLAFSQALDRDGFARQLLPGQGKAYLSFLPPGIPGNDPSAVQQGFDAKAALQRLVDAGYGATRSNKSDPPKIDCKVLGEIKLTFPDTARNRARYQFLSNNLSQVIGCPFPLDPVDPSTFTAMMRKPEIAPQLLLQNWVQDYPHPQDWLSVFACGGLLSSGISYCSQDFDKALAAANAEVDAAKALDKYKAAQKLMLQDYPGAMLYYSQSAYLVKPYILSLRDSFGASDMAWPGQYGALWNYDIDLTLAGPAYSSR